MFLANVGPTLAADVSLMFIDFQNGGYEYSHSINFHIKSHILGHLRKHTKPCYYHIH